MVGVSTLLACGPSLPTELESGATTTTPSTTALTSDDPATSSSADATTTGSGEDELTDTDTDTDSGDDESSIFDLPVPVDPLAQDCFSFASAQGPEVVWERLEPAIGRWRGVVVGPDGTAYVSGDTDPQLAAYDASGHELWSVADEADEAHRIAWSEGRLIVGGTARYSAHDHPDWLRIYSTEGELLDELFVDEGDNAFLRVAAGPDGTILTGGRHHDNPGSLRVTLFEPDLSVRWNYDSGEQFFGSSPPAVTFDELGRPYATIRYGYPEPLGTGRVVRLDEFGEVEWTIELVTDELPAESWPYALAIGEQIYVGGRALGQAWVGGFDDAGLPIWTTSFGDQTWDAVRSVAAVPGGVLVGGGTTAGVADRNAFLALLANDGQLVWSVLAAGNIGRDDVIEDIAVAPNGDIVVVGNVYCSPSPHPAEDVWQPFVARLRPH